MKHVYNPKSWLKIIMLKMRNVVISIRAEECLLIPLDKVSRRLLNREACRAIQRAFLGPSLVNLISKDANLVFYLSEYPFVHS